jgi:outer membrane lipoprotein-sorting protein
MASNMISKVFKQIIKLIYFILLNLCILLFYAINIYGQDAREIIKRADDKLQGSSSISTMRMGIVRPQYTRTIEFKNWSLGRDYFMTYITAPAKDKGQVFMKQKTEIWNFMPAINRMIKLPPGMMGQGWMGSDYTNDDLVRQSSVVTDYEHYYMGKSTIDGAVCHTIEMRPLPNATVVWGKVVSHIDANLYIIRKAEYFDEDLVLVRTEWGKQVKTFDGRDLPSIIEIVPAENPTHKTVIEIVDIKFDVKLEPSFFTQQNMKNVF